jgi:hypothetical protein
MDIKQIRSIQSGAAKKVDKAKASGTDKFTTSVDDEGVGTSDGVSGTIQIPMLTGLMNDLKDQHHQKKRHFMRAELLLDELDKLRIGILDEKISKENLRHLEYTLNKCATIDDQDLKDVILDIETRVSVELAKLEKLKS